MEFRINTNPLTGKPMVEVWLEGEFIASIYVHEDGIRIVSKYLDGDINRIQRVVELIDQYGINIGNVAGACFLCRTCIHGC